MNKGIGAALAAYALWGLLPVYWKALGAVSALQILGHRVVWSFAFAALLLLVRRRWTWLKQTAHSRRTLITFLGTGTILGVNWLTFIWAVNAGYIVDTSLGYFINPLLNVVLGVLFLKERLRPWQWASLTVAGAGVAYLTFNYGAFPWVALTLAVTFAFYGFLHKTADLGALEGLSLETAFMSVPALTYLIYLQGVEKVSLSQAEPGIVALLVFSGVVTALPLLSFNYAARCIPLSTLGFLQYIAPTLQFLVGVVLYKEQFTHARMVGFGLIWIALAIFSLEGAISHQRAPGRQPKPRPAGQDIGR
jgi:chloramphenicol-sensitive protein RarD